MPADAAPANAVHVDFVGTSVDWTWDEATGPAQYRRGGIELAQ